MSPQPTPPAYLFENSSPGDSTAIEEGSEACGDSDSDSSIDSKRQKIIDKKIWEEFCKNLHENIDVQTKKSNKQEEEGYDGAMKQTVHGVEVALAYWNKCQKFNGEPEYVFVAGEACSCCPFWVQNSWWYHTTFKTRVKDDPAAKPKPFFAEVKGQVDAKRGQKVTKMCVLLPTDQGLNGCKACKRLNTRHPQSRGFNIGQLMSIIDTNVHEYARMRKARQCEASRKAKKQSVASRTREREASRKAKEQSVASRTSGLSVGSMSNN